MASNENEKNWNSEVPARMRRYVCNFLVNAMVQSCPAASPETILLRKRKAEEFDEYHFRISKCKVDYFGAVAKKAKIHHKLADMKHNGEEEPKMSHAIQQLQRAFRPNIVFLMKQEEATLFKNPFTVTVDHGVSLNFDKIKHNLEAGQYTDPWDYISDLNEMFQKANTRSRAATVLQRCAAKLSQLADENLDHIMGELGYCCGRKHVLPLKALVCNGKPDCYIFQNQPYFSYQEKYPFCLPCFNDVGLTLKVLSDQSEKIFIKKTKFGRQTHNKRVFEPFVNCKDCGRAWHSVCAMHFDHINTDGFICDTCLESQGRSKRTRTLSAKDLPKTNLSRVLEDRVNECLKKKAQNNSTPIGQVTIRVLSNMEKTTKVGPYMAKRYGSQIPAEYPYRAKALFAFQEIDGNEVCFFGMHVQEYGSSCPAPNKRCVYISFLDSVHFFRPGHLRTTVYHEILIGYLKYARDLGYTTAHVFACPPTKGVDYLFNGHPPDQKIPDPTHLYNWYLKMLRKAVSENVIFDYQLLWEHFKQTGQASPAELPYFDGDLLPEKFEQILMAFEREEKKIYDSKPSALVEGVEVKTKGGRSKKKVQMSLPPSISGRVVNLLAHHKEVLFKINLHCPHAPQMLKPICDPDPLINNPLMDGKGPFMSFAVKNGYNFSTERHAIYSTVAFVNELFSQIQVSTVEHGSGYHHNISEDISPCVKCYKEKNEQEMNKISLGIDRNSEPDKSFEAVKVPRIYFQDRHAHQTVEKFPELYVKSVKLPEWVMKDQRIQVLSDGKLMPIKDTCTGITKHVTFPSSMHNG